MSVGSVSGASPQATPPLAPVKPSHHHHHSEGAKAHQEASPSAAASSSSSTSKASSPGTGGIVDLLA